MTMNTKVQAVKLIGQAKAAKELGGKGIPCMDGYISDPGKGWLSTKCHDVMKNF